jgi:gliding motility-associated protein GldC
MIKSEIKFNVTLDEERIPQAINWEATDSGIEGVKDCLATMITVWDKREKTTMRIDLWTKDMLIDDMKRFFYESLITMADTYKRATQETELADEMKKFAHEFAKKGNILQGH